MTSFNGCGPIAPPTGNQPLRAKLFELAGANKENALGPEDYRGIIVPLVKAFAAADTNGSVSFRAPTTHNFVIEQIRGHVALVGLAAETLDLSAVMVGSFATNPVLTERVVMKAMNARVTLTNSDRSQNIIESGMGSLNLSSILALAGGEPINWHDMPHILPAGESLEMNVNLVQTAAAILGGATEYGLVLIGSFIRVKAS